MTAVAVVHQTAEILFYSFWVLEVFEMVEDVHLVYLLFLQKHEPVLVLGVTAAQSALLDCELEIDCGPELLMDCGPELGTC